MDNPFKAAWWLPGPHLQTLWPTLIRRPKKISLQRERVELPDGDFVDLDWIIHPNQKKNSPIVLILHGLEGSSRSSYARGMLQAIANRGWRGAVMHFRGCSGELNRLPRSYHSGDTNDFAGILNQLIAREPQTPVAVIGYSMGGNVLLKWLGELGQRNQAVDNVVAAVAVSVPFELNKAVDRLQQGFSRLYTRHFLRRLCKKIRTKQRRQPLPLNISSWSHIRTLRDFDDQITAPLHGFSDAEEYYVKSSSRQFLKHINVPTLLLQAKDDPFMTEAVIPEHHELSACVKLEVTEKGGHVGFVSGRTPWQPVYWLEQRIPFFLSDYLHL
jgi:predicted alpha/beta-fold hydrolase